MHFTYFFIFTWDLVLMGRFLNVPYLTRAGLLAVLIVVGGQVLVVRTPAQYMRLRDEGDWEYCTIDWLHLHG